MKDGHRIGSIRSQRPALLLACLIACGLVSSLCGADWRQFRGNRSDGIADDRGPRTFDKIAWTADLNGRGISGPLVVGDRVYVTSSSGFRQDRLHLSALRAADGKVVWERQFWATGRTQCHAKMAVASSTPASDGRHIVAFYSSNDLACLDLDGRLLWYRGLTYDYPNATNSLGMASSPVIVGDAVVVQAESDDDSIAVGLDVETGTELWKKDRPRNANWTTPIVLKGDSADSDLIVLQGAKGLSALRPRTGAQVWSYDDGAATIPSSTVGDKTIYVPSHGLTALAVAAEPHPPQRWRKSQYDPGTPSPVFFQGRIYCITGGSILSAIDAKNGELVWRLRLQGGFTSSPVVAAGQIYLVSDDGRGYVVRLGDKQGKLVSQHSFGESVMCTPAISDGALYVRSDKHLWKVID